MQTSSQLKNPFVQCLVEFVRALELKKVAGVRNQDHIVVSVLLVFGDVGRVRQRRHRIDGSYGNARARK
jgi:hypothetical protein